MSIIRFAFSHAASSDPHFLAMEAKTVWEEGSYCPLGSDNSKESRERKGYALVLWETHVGLCIRDWESNGYSDSDFYMLVWNPEAGKAETICFATTRGWSYPSYGSKPDATPEVLALYREWVEKCKAEDRIVKRRSHAVQMCDFRARLRKIAKANSVPYFRLLKLLRKADADRIKAVTLLLTSKLRSEFRISLKNQLIKWLNDSQPQHESPFSRRQWECV